MNDNKIDRRKTVKKPKDFLDRQKKFLFQRDWDDSLYQNGIKWFNSGATFDEAPEHLKTNDSFKAGFFKGKRLKLINDLIYTEGVKWYHDDYTLDNIPLQYNNNEWFIKGFNDASGMKKKR